MFTVGKLGERSTFFPQNISLKAIQMPVWLYARLISKRVLVLTSTGVDSARRTGTPHRISLVTASAWCYDRLDSEHIGAAEPCRGEEARRGILESAG